MLTRRVRAINWMEHSQRALAAKYPWISDRAEGLNQRLTRLLLERLPRPLAEDLVRLLPDHHPDARSLASLRRSISAEENSRIGFPDFVELAARTSGCEGLSPSECQVVARAIADSYLWSVTQELPIDLKTSLARMLPLELRSRMNLYSSGSDEVKVA